MTAPRRLDLLALPGLPLVRPGDDLAALICDGLRAAGETLVPGDVLVIAQKVVSKAEGRVVDLVDVVPSARARELAGACGKDARVVEVILSESSEVLRHRPGVLVVAHRLGFVMANAGVDASNVDGPGGAERVLLLPRDPDATCRRLRAALAEATAVEVGVIVNDSVGRAWRNGVVGMALGAAGLPPLLDLRGRVDLFGRPLEATVEAVADEIAAAATLLQGQADEGAPVVRVRGLALAPNGLGPGAAALVRPRAEDLFR